MTERQLTTILQKHFKDHPPLNTSTFEIKMVKGSFAFKSVQPHQIDGLKASLEGLQHKISDSPIYEGSQSRFTFKKPFDLVFIRASQAFVTPIFYLPRKYKIAVLIPVVEFEKLRDSHPRKSIKLEELSQFEKIKL